MIHTHDPTFKNDPHWPLLKWLQSVHAFRDHESQLWINLGSGSKSGFLEGIKLGSGSNGIKFSGSSWDRDRTKWIELDLRWIGIGIKWIDVWDRGFGSGSVGSFILDRRCGSLFGSSFGSGSVIHFTQLWPCVTWLCTSLTIVQKIKSSKRPIDNF